jgi:chromate transporter
MFQGIMSGLKPATLGLIGTAALSLATPENFIDWKSFILFAGAFVVTFWLRINPITTIIA